MNATGIAAMKYRTNRRSSDLVQMLVGSWALVVNVLEFPNKRATNASGMTT
jgi:hypothetical protein